MSNSEKKTVLVNIRVKNQCNQSTVNTVIVMEQQIPVAALQTISLNGMQVFVAVYAESDRHF